MSEDLNQELSLAHKVVERQEAEIKRLEAEIEQMADELQGERWDNDLKDKEIEVIRAGYEAAKRNQRGAERAYEKAEAENERLEAALRKIAVTDLPTALKYRISESPTPADIAKEALGDE